MDRGMKRFKQIQILIVFCAASAAVFANTALPDPTRPANFFVKTESVFVEQVAQPGQKLPWTVSAIRISPTDRTAIVNGKLVRVGDVVSSAKVEQINPLSVVIDDDERRLNVRLFQNQNIKTFKKDADLNNGIKSDNDK